MRPPADHTPRETSPFFELRRTASLSKAPFFQSQLIALDIMHSEDTTHTEDLLWEPAVLESSNSSELALRLNDSNREEGFPNVYRLLDPHPLRPKEFTRAKYPRGTDRPFYDYVLPIRKTSDFMELWQRVGAETATPTDDASVIEKQGTWPLLDRL